MSKIINYSEVLESKRLMVGVLSVSFLLSAGNAISGTIPAMEEAFSNISKANIETLTTIPTAGIMLGQRELCSEPSSRVFSRII